MHPRIVPKIIPEAIPQTKDKGPDNISRANDPETGRPMPKKMEYPIIEITSSILYIIYYN